MYDGLYHSGVPGQKWGVRHGPPYPVSRDSGGKPRGVVSTNKKQMTSATKAQYKSSPEGAREGVRGAKRIKRAIRVSTLTDDELRARIARLKLEKEYKDLVRGPVTAKQMSEGKKIAYKVIGDVGSMAAKGLVDITVSRLSAPPKKARDTYIGYQMNKGLINAAADAKAKSEKKQLSVDEMAERMYRVEEARRIMEERLAEERRQRSQH